MSEVMEKEQLEQPGTAPDVQAGLPEKKSLRETVNAIIKLGKRYTTFSPSFFHF